MHFNSFVFAVFLPTVFALYWALHRSLRAQNIVILLASYLFYAWWDWRFLGLFIGSAMADFFVGVYLARPDRPPRARLVALVTGLTLNLTALGVFKYFNFFVGSLQDALGLVGLPLDLGTLDLILPLGISFYTFQSMSYSLDVYRGLLKPTRDPVAYMAYVAFFPQLVAGPIERAETLLPAFLAPRTFDAAKARDGLRQILWGLTKKVVIADNLAGPVELAYNGDPGALSGLGHAIATSLFFVQVYCDFSGYSDIAIGSARLFGFSLTRNFAFPFFSTSLTEFWRRWHVTLNTWLRDYVFLVLEMRTRRKHMARRAKRPPEAQGPRTPPRWRTALNIFIVFLLSGLWHGAAWTYVLMGAVTGVYLSIELFLGTPVARQIVAFDRALPTLREALAILRVNVLTMLSLVLFRAETVTQAGLIYAQMLTSPLAGSSVAPLLGACLLALAPIVLEWFQRRRQHGLEIDHWPTWARWSAYLALCLVILVHGNTRSREFVYFQF